MLAREINANWSSAALRPTRSEASSDWVVSAISRSVRKSVSLARATARLASRKRIARCRSRLCRSRNSGARAKRKDMGSDGKLHQAVEGILHSGRLLGVLHQKVPQGRH